MVVARATKTHDTIVPDFYKGYYCTRIPRGILLYQISMRDTIVLDSTGQKTSDVE